ncbi:hypothetical protein AMR74_16110 [Halorubrum tropicale]|uniref:Zinc finger FPG/IleRS-type domain-containing protein n=1 Tax=Halorubrum tropicale TaxID=1765655 RepID=A0A0N0BPN9_9EURY|nr:hypothetical protein AMR74_16110 [Halorubrum tropicale]
MPECAACGVGSNRAVLVDADGETLCTSCADGYCDRCGTETEHTTIAGDFLCERCQRARRDQEMSRDAGQGALGDFV